MRAIILAAGRGNRLAGFNPDGRPKSLIEIGGRSLLSRMLQSLSEAGITRADLVVGYEADRIIESVSHLMVRPEIAFHYNPRFELGSVLSLAAAKPALDSGNDVLVMDADVLFHPGILARIVNSEHQNCLLVDRGFTPGDEPVKVAIRGGEMVEFRKKLHNDLNYDAVGESVGFFRFEPSVAVEAGTRCETYESEGLADAPHEEVIRDMLLSSPERYGYEDVTGMPWLEMDFPEDIDRAVKEVLPAIRKDFPGF